MVLTLILAAMTAAVVAALAVPALRTRHTKPRRAEFDLAVYRDQLRDLDADLERGVISGAEEEAARTEIMRRMLAAAPEGGPDPESAAPPVRPGGLRLGTVIGIALLVPAFAVLLYLLQGAPAEPDRPIAGRFEQEPSGAEFQARVVERIASLREQLGADPENLPAWIDLGQTYLAASQFTLAAGAFAAATALAPDRPGPHALLGEAMVYAAQGTVVPPAKIEFEIALAGEPDNVAARFYLALERAQAGELQQAFDQWLALYRDSPAGASWLGPVLSYLQETARDLDIDLAAVLPELDSSPPPPGAGLTRAEIDAAQAMSDEERESFIRDMVERLAARLVDEPGDAEGWLRLARSWVVLGESDKAREALDRATALRPGDVEVLDGYARALRELSPPGPILAPELLEIYGQILDLDPAHPDALFFLGLGALQTEDRTAALGYWERLLPLLEPGTEIHRIVASELETLRAGK